jgi:hypothetical protein
MGSSMGIRSIIFRHRELGLQLQGTWAMTVICRALKQMNGNPKGDGSPV